MHHSPEKDSAPSCLSASRSADQSKMFRAPHRIPILGSHSKVKPPDLVPPARNQRKAAPLLESQESLLLRRNQGAAGHRNTQSCTSFKPVFWVGSVWRAPAGADFSLLKFSHKFHNPRRSAFQPLLRRDRSGSGGLRFHHCFHLLRHLVHCRLDPLLNPVGYRGYKLLHDHRNHVQHVLSRR